jgi:hypothetical protein
LPLSARGPLATKHDVRRLFGQLEDRLVAEFLANDPTVEELNEIRAWLEREGDVMAWQGRTKAQGIAAIFEYVMHGDRPGSKS